VASRLQHTIREELLALQTQSPDKILYPREALEWARAHKASALYSALEWDNRQAAESWRLQQIRQLITLHITYADGSPQVISLSIDRVDGGGYRQITDVMKIPNLRKIALMDALRDLERIRLKYQHLEELVFVWQAVDGVVTVPPGPGPGVGPGPQPGPGAAPKRPRGPRSGGGAGGAGPRKQGPKRPPGRSLDIPPIRAGE
jgi:hypothetical protein